MLILASASSGRKDILKKLGLKFKVIPANLDEEKIIASLRRQSYGASATNPIKLVKKIARAKALTVAQGVRGACQIFEESPSESAKSAGERFNPAENFRRATSARPPEYLIIAADSMIVFKGKIYGKPKTKNEAKEFLQRLSGKTHEFLTGLFVINTKTNKTYQTSEKSKVIFAKLTPKEIDDYVNTAAVTSFAGGYSLEGKGSEIIRKKMKIVGSETNVIGLPVEKFIQILRKNQINLENPRLNLL